MKEIKDLLFEKNSLESEGEEVKEEIQRNMKKLHYIRSDENLENIEVQDIATKLMAEISSLEKEAEIKQKKLSTKKNEIEQYQKNKERRGEQIMYNLEKRYLEGSLDVVNLDQGQKETLEKDLFFSGLKSLASNNIKPQEKYKEFRALTVDGNSNHGGDLLVPKFLFKKILSKAIDQSVIFSKINVSKVPGKLELIYDDSNVFSTWHNDTEKTKVTEAVNLTSIILTPKLHSVVLEISKLLLETTEFDIEEYVIDKVSKKMALDIDKQIILGTGVGTPTGIITALGTADKQIELDMTYKDVTSKIRTALDSPYIENSKLYMNRKMLGMLDSITDKNERPIFQTRGYEDTFNGRILDQQVIISSLIPDDTIIFGDLYAGYHMNIAINMDATKYDGALKGSYSIGFMFTEAMDGNIVDPNAIIVFKKK